MSEAAETLYHMCPTETWEHCTSTNTPYFPPTYAADGFIHLTADPLLLLPVANNFYTQDKGDWIVLCIKKDDLTSEVIFEPAAPVGTRPPGDFKSSTSEEPLFPHLYGTIDFQAVFKTLPMQREADGTFTGITGL